ncbi:MAG: hypothetical protein WAJ91_05210, partial [Rhodoplanes sp.]
PSISLPKRMPNGRNQDHQRGSAWTRLDNLGAPSQLRIKIVAVEGSANGYYLMSETDAPCSRTTSPATIAMICNGAAILATLNGLRPIIGH